MDNKKMLTLLDLVDLVEWQKIQDAFSNALEITLQTVYAGGNLLTVASRPNKLCHTYALSPKAQDEFCEACLLRNNVKDIMQIQTTTDLKCQLGMTLYVVPIKVAGEKIVAHLLVGPAILKERKSKKEYEKDAKELGINFEELLDALIEVNVFTYNKIYFIIDLLTKIFTHIALAGYHKKRLGEIAPKILEMDPMFARYYEEKVLNALLNACTLALDADSGSVMTLDKQTKSLHIKVSQKLDQQVVDNTNIKVGEGIAGYAVASAQPIILPKDEDKKGISGKLKRKYIKSSMVIPFHKGDNKDICGVINLNVVRKDKDFSDRDLAIVQELTSFASIALAGVQQNPEQLEELQD